MPDNLAAFLVEEAGGLERACTDVSVIGIELDIFGEPLEVNFAVTNAHPGKRRPALCHRGYSAAGIAEEDSLNSLRIFFKSPALSADQMTVYVP